MDLSLSRSGTVISLSVVMPSPMDLLCGVGEGGRCGASANCPSHPSSEASISSFVRVSKAVSASKLAGTVSVPTDTVPVSADTVLVSVDPILVSAGTVSVPIDILPVSADTVLVSVDLVLVFAGTVPVSAGTVPVSVASTAKLIYGNDTHRCVGGSPSPIF